jgi:hypothetical protein
VDLSELIASSRVRIVCEIDRAKLTARFVPEAALVMSGHVTAEHAPSVQHSPEYFDQARQAIADICSHCRTSISTIVTTGRKTAQNIAANLPTYLSTPGIAPLKNACAGKPALIISAGPSLQKNKHLLAEAQSRCVTIAVQTTLQMMLDMGVEPHFVTSLDFHEVCRKFFEKVPAGCKTHLVAEPKANPAIFDVYPGPVSVLGSEFAEQLVRERAPGRAQLRAGATVAHLAFYLAEYMGCDPIIFVGQDLGFSGGMFYAPGTMYDDVWRPELSRFCTLETKQWEQIARDKPILRRAVDYRGRPTYTEERLFSYQQQFERDFAASKATILDATEGGLLKRGARPITLREALDKHCPKSLDLKLPVTSQRDSSSLPVFAKLLDHRIDEASKIADIANQTLPLLEEVRDHLHDQARVNQLIARIDQLRSRMNGLADTYELVMGLSQKTEMSRFTADQNISASRGTALDKQRLQTLRDIDNVAAVARAAQQFVELCKTSAERLHESARGGAK